MTAALIGTRKVLWVAGWVLAVCAALNLIVFGIILYFAALPQHTDLDDLAWTSIFTTGVFAGLSYLAFAGWYVLSKRQKVRQ